MIYLAEEQAQQIEEVLSGMLHGTDWNNGTHAKIYRPKFPEALATIRAARAQEQAEQDPVAWLYDWEHEGEIVTGWVTQDFETTKFNNGHNVRPLYAAAPWRDIEEAVKAERQKISKTFWAAVNSCITTEELGIEFMNKFYLLHIFGHWLDRE